MMSPPHNPSLPGLGVLGYIYQPESQADHRPTGETACVIRQTCTVETMVPSPQNSSWPLALHQPASGTDSSIQHPIVKAGSEPLDPLQLNKGIWVAALGRLRELSLPWNIPEGGRN